ncbi:MAG: hypothetical protein M9938_00590 [Solirubrobacterales bacterium]|nr:hypothetical protein [Solirubrobacterales bacterium]
MFNDSVPTDATGYVFVAYTVFLVMLLIYVGILARKYQRLNREIDRLTGELETPRPEQTDPQS